MSECTAASASENDYHFRIFAYRETGNLGDCIQSIALAGLLGPNIFAVFRDEPHPPQHRDVPLVVNGWLAHRAPSDLSPAIFAGIHLARFESEHLEWTRRSHHTVGARDPFTFDLLKSCGIPAALIGCATLTFPRYTGRRTGRYSIDVSPRPGTEFLPNAIGNLDWADQWQLATYRLDQLRKAEVVYSSRLHIILPCLAFGTPVAFPAKELNPIFDKHRLGLLSALGFTFDEVITLDVTTWAEKYCSFLKTATGCNLVGHSQPISVPRVLSHALDRENTVLPQPKATALSRRPRIFYHCSAKPTEYLGRQHQLCDHVMLLRNKRYEAYLVQTEASTYVPDDAAIPTLDLWHLGELYSPETDVVVVPDSATIMLRSIAGRIVCLARSKRSMSEISDVFLSEGRVLGILADSCEMQEFATYLCPKITSHIVHHRVDTSTFRPAIWREKEPLIVIESTNRDTERLVTLVTKRLGSRVTPYWVSLDNRSRAEVADLFRRALIVLSMGQDTDPGVVLDACASGCVVLAPYIQVHLPVELKFPAKDEFAIAKTIERLLCSFTQNGAYLEPLCESLRVNALTYDLQRQERELILAWKLMLDGTAVDD
jgi:hypothetical protein